MQRTRIYECMCLLDNREVRKGWQPLKEAVTAMFQRRGAEVVSAKRWDERRLAFPIKGQQRGTYLLAYIKADTQQVTGIRRDLQFNEGVLRSLMVNCAEVPPAAFEPEAEFDVNAIPVEERPVVAEAPVVVESAVTAAEPKVGDDGGPSEEEVEAR